MYVSSVLTYQEIKGDLYIYISVSGQYQGKNTTLLVELVDGISPASFNSMMVMWI